MAAFELYDGAIRIKVLEKFLATITIIFLLIFFNFIRIFILGNDIIIIQDEIILGVVNQLFVINTATRWDETSISL